MPPVRNHPIPPQTNVESVSLNGHTVKGRNGIVVHKTNTICLAVEFPFKPYNMKWPELDKILNQAWGLSTRLANWAMTLVHRLDQEIVFKAGRPDKLPAMSADKIGGIYLYEHLRAYPEQDELLGIKKCVQATLRGIRKKYTAVRLDVLWRRSASLPSFRYPYPFAIHNKDWTPFYGKDNIPLVDLVLPGGRVTLELRGGSEMRRQLARFRQIVVGGAKKGEAVIYRKGEKCMVKMVADFPIVSTSLPTDSDKVLLVKTDPNALWVVEGDNIKTRVWNQDHIKHCIENHRIWLQRISEDTKHEKRASASMKHHMIQKRDDRCRKQNARLDSFCHEMSKQLAQFAERQKVGAVMYNDNVQDYLPRFPWFQLREKLKYKLKERGIKLLIAPNSSGQAG